MQRTQPPTNNIDDRTHSHTNTSSSWQTSPGPNGSFSAPKRQHSAKKNYFAGPRDLEKHSKWPNFMQLHGSILPKMVVPLMVITVWTILITCVSKFVKDLSVSNVLLTILGFVVGFSLSFRVSSGYERYSEGRKYWAQLTLSARNLSRVIWVEVKERHSESSAQGTEDLLLKLTTINLLNAFAVALKHHLRFEPAAGYPDLRPQISHLDNIIALNVDQSQFYQPKPSALKVWGEYLGVSFAQDNPRKLIKRSRDNLGNVPVEILTCLASLLSALVREGIFDGNALGSALGDVRSLLEVACGTERVQNTPLPLAYKISISQITWAYIFVLPFQLFKPLGWIAIPGTIFAAYIILGMAIIGHELEDPFGHDVNDLPLDSFCLDIANNIDILTSIPAHNTSDFVKNTSNRVLYPLSLQGYDQWRQKDVGEIREALKARATTNAQTVYLQRNMAFAESTNIGTDEEEQGPTRA